VKFIDGDRKSYGKRSSKVLGLKAGLPFDESNFGPYGEDHAKLLATLILNSRMSPDHRRKIALS
jgi:hypothetical protein